MLNKNSLDTLCGALCYALGIDPPEHAANRNDELSDYIDKIFCDGKADRLFMYNPDAIAQWIYEKYPYLCAEAKAASDIELPLCSVMPSVTPVCFGTMYTGAQPEVHGIRRYEKPVIKIDSFFDALVRAGKRVAIVSYGKSSMSHIFLERDIDYYLCPEGGSVSTVNAIAAELIIRDSHDVIVVYNGNYDAKMHKVGPEHPIALAELRANVMAFAEFSKLIERNWKDHNTLVGFAMDHGCHEIDGECGSHGLDMKEDLNILHLYRGYPRERI